MKGYLNPYMHNEIPSDPLLGVIANVLLEICFWKIEIVKDCYSLELCHCSNVREDGMRSQNAPLGFKKL